MGQRVKELEKASWRRLGSVRSSDIPFCEFWVSSAWLFLLCLGAERVMKKLLCLLPKTSVSASALRGLKTYKWRSEQGGAVKQWSSEAVKRWSGGASASFNISLLFFWSGAWRVEKLGAQGSTTMPWQRWAVQRIRMDAILQKHVRSTSEAAKPLHECCKLLKVEDVFVRMILPSFRRSFFNLWICFSLCKVAWPCKMLRSLWRHSFGAILWRD